jgi:hypothetical protein
MTRSVSVGVLVGLGRARPGTRILPFLRISIMIVCRPRRAFLPGPKDYKLDARGRAVYPEFVLTCFNRARNNVFNGSVQENLAQPVRKAAV